MTHLVTLSGGPDSVWCLKHVLETTDDPVLALHVVLVDRYGRHEMETLACKRITSYCRKNFREFEYQTAKFAPPPSRSYYDWLPVCAVVGTVLAARHDVTDVWGGTIVDDGAVSQRDADGEAVAKLVAREMNPEVGAVRFHFEPSHLTKRAIRDDLGPDLWDLTWSCRVPVLGKPCNRCLSCERRNHACA